MSDQPPSTSFDPEEPSDPTSYDVAGSVAATPSMVRRILVPLDLNRLSEGKLPATEAQARAFGAEVILLHVIANVAPSDEAVTVAESQSITYLNALAARLRSNGIAAHSLVRYGPPAEAILDEIVMQKADLVVLGASTRRGVSRLLLGSVAEEIIARAPCPVLLIRPNLDDAEVSRPVRSFGDDVARTGPVAPRPLGLRVIETARVVGSVGRSIELDESFRIRGGGKIERQRYERIKARMENGDPLPPVVLYKLGYGYYVVDGNHRVAAARELGQMEMEAEVTEFVPLRDPQGQRVFAERRAFERATGLTRVGAARPGTYSRIEARIREFGEAKGVSHEKVKDVARAWESEEFRPVSRRIRSLRLGQYLPDQRTADIFVTVADFRDQESERESLPIGWDEALTRFRAKYRS